MSTIEVKPNKSKLIFYLIFILAAVVASMYFLYLTETFPEQTTKIAGTLANGILLYGAWLVFRRIQTNPTELLIAPDKLGFYEQKNWIEIPFSNITSFRFKNFYDRYKWARQLILVLSTGEQKIIELNELDTNQAELERILNEKKSW
jgi:hypothetical protein